MQKDAYQVYYYWQPIPPALRGERGCCQTDPFPCPSPFSFPLLPFFLPPVCASPPIAPVTLWVCLGPVGEALSVNTGALAGPRGPSPWIPTLWEPPFHFTPLSLRECLSNEVRKLMYTLWCPYTSTWQEHTHIFSLSHLYAQMQACIHTYTILYTQTEREVQ